MSANYTHQMYHKSLKKGCTAPPPCLNKLCPSPDIIISHDGKKVLSRFEDDEWDLNPYSLSPNNEPIINFVRILKLNNQVSELERSIIDEMKHFLLVLLYVNKGGRFGSISVSTFRKYFYTLAEMGRFCIHVNSKGGLKVISLKDLLSRPHFFSIFTNANPDVLRKRGMIDLFNTLRPVSQKHLGFKVANIEFDEKIARSHNQHPVIPADIYLNLVNGLSADIEFLGEQYKRLASFIAEFKDKAVGRALSRQKALGISKKEYRLTVPELIQKHNLGSLFHERYNVSNVATLVTALIKIQFVCFHTIVLYTGMRKTEALNMPFNCISEEVVTPAVFDDNGEVAVEAEVINIVSYTTKYTGIKEVASWLANEDVLKAIRILQGINSGFTKSERKDFSDNLFVSPNHLKGKSRVRTVFKTAYQPDWYNNLVIKQEDLDILRATNPEDQLRENYFIVGKPWPLSAHQFRRTLAFYAANSGFVSLPTLTIQFKHLASAMTKYYYQNYESINTIFGYFNPETNCFDLPDEHILFDFKEARVAVVVDTLVNEVINTDEVLYGKSSNYIHKQRADIKKPDDLAHVLELREKTEKAVINGEIYYRKTLLGGCTNFEECDCRMLGEFTSCLSNVCAVIKPQNIAEQIAELTSYLKLLEPRTGEYQIVEEELNALIAFRKHEQGRIE